jgi:hypothetical protein
MVAARDRNIIVFDALAFVVGLVIAAVQDAIAPRGDATLLLRVNPARLVQLVSGEESNVVLFVVGEDGRRVRVFLVEAQLVHPHQPIYHLLSILWL